MARTRSVLANVSGVVGVGMLDSSLREKVETMLFMVKAFIPEM